MLQEIVEGCVAPPEGSRDSLNVSGGVGRAGTVALARTAYILGYVNQNFGYNSGMMMF